MEKHDADSAIRFLDILKDEEPQNLLRKTYSLPGVPKNRNVRGTIAPTWIDELYQGARDYHAKKRDAGTETS
ncbi:hypothetical protein C823_000683 [Eubacterium plexicaudatum ASF492]|uniref:Uncharacterized protein n=1 Tax=Eubacterium plexicaudatum ASF492 TaxID=1235802 RepID=N2A8U6_9FIRM|nr:hypothetical protein C823_000683 [Eubacterium plexicaudatum ASF492]